MQSKGGKVMPQIHLEKAPLELWLLSLSSPSSNPPPLSRQTQSCCKTSRTWLRARQLSRSLIPTTPFQACPATPRSVTGGLKIQWPEGGGLAILCPLLSHARAPALSPTLSRSLSRALSRSHSLARSLSDPAARRVCAHRRRRGHQHKDRLQRAAAPRLPVHLPVRRH